jgi:hypothetical protein
MQDAVLTPFIPLFAATIAAQASAEAADDSISHVGFELSAGLPDGLGFSLLGRPWSWLELHLGAVYNTASFGIQGGVTVAPLDWVVRPTLTLEGGHYFPGDANGLGKMITGDDAFSSPLLEEISYSWGTAHLGIDIGVDEFRFFLRGGISYVRAPLTADGAITVGEGSFLHAFVPTAKVGFNSFLF